MGMKDLSDESLARLAEHLKWRQTLVVLDSCEHVIDAAVESAETLLGSCGALKIVATSREALGMAGEQIFAVRSLSLPATTDLDEMQRSEAVRLFVDHARLVLPDFAVDERNAAAIAEICRRLDGIALAIELAAARVKVLSVDEIRARLDDRFRLLTGGNRAMPRHQTLHATMQWSHDHLTSREQRLFRRLAVFAGGCTLPAAVDVAGDTADEYDTLECLTALHDKSLVMVDRDTQAQPRYRMLETVRQYAEERLTEAGEGDEVRNRHLLHYVALGERATPDLNGPRQGEWLPRASPRAGEPGRRARMVRARGTRRRARVAADRVAVELIGMSRRNTRPALSSRSRHSTSASAIPIPPAAARRCLGCPGSRFGWGGTTSGCRAPSDVWRSGALSTTPTSTAGALAAAGRRSTRPASYRARLPLPGRPMTWRDSASEPKSHGPRSTASRKSIANTAISPTRRRSTSRQSRSGEHERTHAERVRNWAI